MVVIWYLLTGLSVTGTFLPLLSYDYWLVRSQEYLKYYYLISNIILLIAGPFLISFSPIFYMAVALLCLGIVHCNRKITPYTPLATKTIEIVDRDEKKQVLKLLIFNVFQESEAYGKLIELIEGYSPDIVSLFETNQEWAENLRPLKETYKYGVEKILENTYGTILLSKIPLITSDINHFVDEKIPSTEVVIDINDSRLRLLGLHPEPPIVGESQFATKKNKEFQKVYRYLFGISKEEHLILHGDLNDVAWGKYPRMIKRKLNLRDPRIGRGFYPTFPTYFPLKIPLDHLYLSPKIDLVDFKLLKDIGSDHYPVYAEIQI